MTREEAAEYLRTCVIDYLGGFEATGRVCGRSGKAVQKWVSSGRLPRTEATGETNYSGLMAEADTRIDRERLLATVMKDGLTRAHGAGRSH